MAEAPVSVTVPAEGEPADVTFATPSEVVALAPNGAVPATRAFAAAGTAPSNTTTTSASPSTASSTVVASPNSQDLSAKTDSSTSSPGASNNQDHDEDSRIGGPVRPWTDSLQQGRMQITSFIVRAKKQSLGQHVPESEMQNRREDVRAFLWHLEFQVRPSPSLKADPLNIDKALKLLFREDVKAHVPEEIWRWGSAIYANSRSRAAPAAAPAPALAPAQPAGANIPHLPPANHPIWGVNGIMHGVVMASPGNYPFDPRYKYQKRNARVFGHNGLAPGAWWPIQALALFHGAHGHTMKGIVGEPAHGAFSIVVSGKSSTYHDLDRDYGDTIWYSADRPNAAGAARSAGGNQDESNDARSLRQSIRTRRPVRVLRSSGRRDRGFAPRVGIRYDGLYTVKRAIPKRNESGGTFYKFLLRRLPGQVPLQQICASSPSPRQVRDEGLFRSGY
ncbi:PUA-like domain-containing protein [Achaetomium macrosporum]|uniref:PUA-like domain-containing protein n=1 Tax=Achaetomium macrosporum TaxID=79813 RepID=A0AAN7C5E4_9PEZI|nr:PUA-like domain-containing protein [Achaetomium macrosporum]